MAIRWSAKSVDDYLAQMEKELDKIVKPFARVRELCRQAEQVPNLPQYMQQFICSIRHDCNSAIGRDEKDATAYWPLGHGRYKEDIRRVRSHIPQEDLAKEKARQPLLDMNKIATMSKGQK